MNEDISGFVYFDDDFSLSKQIAGTINDEVGPPLIGTDPTTAQNHLQSLRTENKYLKHQN